MNTDSDRPDADATAGHRLLRVEREMAEQRGSRKLLTWIVSLVGGSALVGVVTVIISVVRVDVLEKRVEQSQRSLDTVADVRSDLRVLATELRHEAAQNRAVNSATVQRLDAIEQRLQAVTRRR